MSPEIKEIMDLFHATEAPIISHNERSIKPKTTPLAKHMPNERITTFFNDEWDMVLNPKDEGRAYLIHRKSGAEMMFWIRDLALALRYFDMELLTKPEPRNPRKVIQMTQGANGVIATCDDGTMWILPYNVEGAWIKIKPVPQD